MNDRRTIGAAVVAIVLLLLRPDARRRARRAADDTGSARRTITGTATGKVEGVPDTLTVTLGVETHSGSAQDALAQNSERATRVIAALKARASRPEDLQTTQLSLNPTFDQKGRTQRLRRSSNVVTARTHDVVNGGKVVDAAAAQAGTTSGCRGSCSRSRTRQAGRRGPAGRGPAGPDPGPTSSASAADVGLGPGREDHRAAAGRAGVLRPAPGSPGTSPHRRRRSSPAPRS